MLYRSSRISAPSPLLSHAGGQVPSSTCPSRSTRPSPADHRHQGRTVYPNTPAPDRAGHRHAGHRTEHERSTTCQHICLWLCPLGAAEITLTFQRGRQRTSHRCRSGNSSNNHPSAPAVQRRGISLASLRRELPQKVYAFVSEEDGSIDNIADYVATNLKDAISRYLRRRRKSPVRQPVRYA